MNRWLADRLKELKKPKTGLAKAMGVHHARVHDIIKGERRIAAAEVPAVADYLEWPEEKVWQLINRRRSARPKVAIAGYIGAGAAVFPIDDHAKGAGMDDVEIPPSEGVVAARVRGDSQLPVYRDNDVILYQRNGTSPAELIGVECAVQLAEPDGRMLIKTIKRGPTPKTFTLTSHNASDIEGVKIEWAAPVLWVKRG
jgi:phage repressor protein C with HTH and peptisase S24 domain